VILCEAWKTEQLQSFCILPCWRVYSLILLQSTSRLWDAFGSVCLWVCLAEDHKTMHYAGYNEGEAMAQSFVTFCRTHYSNEQHNIACCCW
jgi:hypothetical protein